MHGLIDGTLMLCLAQTWTKRFSATQAWSGRNILHLTSTPGSTGHQGMRVRSRTKLTIKFERDWGAPIRPSGASDRWEGERIFHPLDNEVHVNFLEVKLWKLWSGLCKCYLYLQYQRYIIQNYISWWIYWYMFAVLDVIVFLHVHGQTLWCLTFQ